MDYLVRASLACNLNEGEKAPEIEFYSHFIAQNKIYVQSIEKHQENVKEDIYNLLDKSIAQCKEIFTRLDTEHPIVFKLFVASKAAGIYECENNCTFELIRNKNLLLRNIHVILLDDNMDALLQRACEQGTKECEDAITDMKNEDFTQKPWETQVSTFALLIKALAVEIENTYITWAKQHPECGDQMHEFCKGIVDISMSYFSLTLLIPGHIIMIEYCYIFI